MATRLLNVLLRCALLVGVASSSALFVEYRSAKPAFCGAGGGCEAVKAWAADGLLQYLPAVGLGTFLGLICMAAWASTRRHHAWLALQTGVVALGALTLIGLQVAVIGAVCAWCMAVDLASLVAAGCAVLLWRREPDVEPRGLRYLWGGAALVAVAVPMLWQPPPKIETVAVPSEVQRLYQPDKVDIVMFTDFECPFCRRMHPLVDGVAESHHDRVRLTRVMVPLEFHKGALPAALAYLCTPDDTQEAMASALYAAEPGRLTPSGVIAIGAELGVDSDRLAKCMADPSTQRAIERDKELFQRAGLRGLPATYVESTLVTGAREPEFLAAVDRALAGSKETSGGPAYMIAFMVIVALLVAAVSLLQAARAQPEEPEGAASTA